MSKNKIDDYWTLRALEYEQQAYDETTEHLKKINNAYLEAQIYLMDQANQIYRRYFNGQVSEDDANKILNSTISASEMVALKSLASTVQDRESKKAIRDYLSQLAAKNRITRLDEWKFKAYISAKAAGATEKAENLKLYSEVVKQAWKQADKEGIAYQTGKEFELPNNGKSDGEEFELPLNNSKGEKVTDVKVQKDQPIKEVKEIPADYVEKVANRKWSGRNYSQRIWNNTDQLANHLGELFTAKEIAGMSETDLANKIADEFQTSIFNSKRLIRTEAAHLANQAKIDRWKARGVKYYRYVAVLDNRTSKICRSLNAKVLEVVKAQTGKNFPPMHPFCRSVAVIVPKLTDAEQYALNRYLSSDSYRLNNELRSHGINGLSDSYKEMVKDLDSALSKLPTYTSTRPLQRDYFMTDEGVKEFLKEHKQGSIFKDQSYISTSKEHYGEGTEQIHVEIRNSVSGHDISLYNNQEQEVLFGRNTRFKIESVWEDSDGIIQMKWRELNEPK